MAENASDRFARAVVPSVVRLAGRRLGPLTLGHLSLLRRVGSPFDPLKLALPIEATVGQVAVAWYIVTRPWMNAADGIGTRLGKWSVTWFSIRRAGQCISDAAVLADWIADQVALPPFKKAGGGEEDGQRGTPHELLLSQALASQWHVGWPDVLDVPVAQANWLWMARWEEQNQLRIPADGVMAEEDALRRATDPDERKRREEWAAKHEAELRASSAL